MAGQVAIIEDSSLLSRLDIILLKLERFCALISGLTIFSLMFLAVYSVSGRKFFNAPLAGYVDYIEAALPVIAIMGVSYVQRDGSHIRMDIFVSLLKGRALWLFELLSILLILLLILYLIFRYVLAWIRYFNSLDSRLGQSTWRWSYDYPVVGERDISDLDDKIFVRLRRKRNRVITLMYSILLIMFLLSMSLLSEFLIFFLT